MNMSRLLLLLAATCTLLLTSTSVALADESGEGPGAEAAATDEPSDQDNANRTVADSGGTVSFSCPSFGLIENWTQRTTTYSVLDASGALARTWSRTELRATIVKSPQGTTYTDRGNWVTTWRADTGITAMNGVFEDIRDHGRPVVSDYGRIVINGDGLVLSTTGHHPADAYAWCVALQ